MLLWRRVPIVLALLAGGVALLALALTASAAPLATTRTYPGAPGCTTTLQACINVSSAGDQINIAAGTYIQSFTLNKAVSLVGANQSTTILRALAGNRTLTVTNAVTNGTVISNLTLQGGTLATGNGGAMWVQSGAQPTLQNLTIQSGTVAATTAFGGGLFTQSDLTLTNVNFIANTAHEDGGGLLATGNLTVNGGTFSGNVSQNERGGALSVGGDLVMNGTTITNNQSFDSGGAILVTGTTTLNNALIVNNRSTAGSGGAVRASGAAFISNTQFISNTSFNPGGGMRATTSVFLTNTTFMSNTAGVGGGDNRGGGLFANAAANITGGVFQGNTAGTGGGAQVEGLAAVVDTLFDRNSAATEGGGLRVVTATLQGASFNRNQVLAGNGGGLWASNYAVVSSSFFTANTVISGTSNASTGSGGGAFSDGEMFSTQNAFVGNFAYRLGGGLDADDLSSFRDQFRGNGTGPQGTGGGLHVSAGFGVSGALFYTNTSNTGGGMGVNSGANGTVDNSLFARNVVTFSDGGAALRLLSANQVHLTHNTLVGTNAAGRAAVHMQGAGDYFFNANIFANHARGLVQFGLPPTSTVSTENNVFYSVTLPYLDGLNPIVGKASNITGTVAFRNAAGNDYRLAPIGAPVDFAPSYGFTEDFEGDPRPMGLNFDAGFDETASLPIRVNLPFLFR